MAMVIYHFFEIIWRILITTNFLYNIYDHEKYYTGEQVNKHIQSLINIVQGKNGVTIAKKG